jgi:hypothetical protein
MRTIAVLDAYFHQDLVKTLPEGERRGRPDIVHNCLSLCQNSIPNRKGVLRVYVHTRDDKVIEVEPEVDIPPNYIKFLDLTQSNVDFIAELIISTLRDGYGAAIDGLEPVFSISMGGEIIYVDFEEFKRLTSQ